MSETNECRISRVVHSPEFSPASLQSSRNDRRRSRSRGPSPCSCKRPGRARRQGRCLSLVLLPPARTKRQTRMPGGTHVTASGLHPRQGGQQGVAVVVRPLAGPVSPRRGVAQLGPAVTITL